MSAPLRKPCCDSPLLGPHRPGCNFEPWEENPVDCGQLFPVPPGPEVLIVLDQKLRAGIAAQLRTLADLLDPPGGS